jgi:hypothetical protein
MVTDLRPEELQKQQSANLQDVIFPNGIATTRGAPASTDVANPFTTQIKGVYVTLNVAPSVGHVYHISSTLGEIYNSQGGAVATTISLTSSPQGILGRGLLGSHGLGYASPSSSVTTPSVTRIPFCVFQNEVLWFAQDGVSPIIRTTTAAFPGSVSSSGTITGAVGTTALSGSGTSFTSNINAYIDIPGLPPNTALVRSASSATSASIATPLPAALSGATLGTTRVFGNIALTTQVNDTGTATVSSTTLSGQGTNWTQSGAGFGAVAIGDVVSWKGTNGANMFVRVTAVTNDTTLTVTPGGTGTTLPYTICRPAVGKHGCVHNNRLWITGVAWQRRRVYYTPLVSSTQVAGNGLVQWTLGDPTNGNYSWSQQPGDANQLDWVDVPDDNTEGYIVAVADSPSGLLILATDGCYILTGDPPSENVRLVAAGADCLDARSVVSSHGSVFWAGRQGIFRFVGGRIADITANARNAEWRSLMWNNGGTSPTLIGYFTRGHYVLSTGTQTWVYDSMKQRWCGNHTTSQPLAACTEPTEDQAYVAPSTHNTSITRMCPVYLDTGDADPNAVFIGDIPPSAAGDISSIKRITEERITYDMTAGSGSVQSAMDPTVISGFTYGTDATLSATTGLDTVRILPNSDVTQTVTGSIGKSGRAFYARITATGCTSFHVSSFEMFRREFTPGA